jgi:hypothetical protein
MREIDLLEHRLALRKQRRARRERNQQTDRISAKQEPPPTLKGGLYRKAPNRVSGLHNFAMRFRLTQSKHNEHHGEDDNQHGSYGVDVRPKPTLLLPIFELRQEGRRLPAS